MRIFDKAELKLFESLFNEKLEPIRKRHDSERHKIDWTPSPSNKLYLHIAEHKRFKREYVDARVHAYMETCQRVLKHPKNIDCQEFQIELVALAQGATREIERVYNDPLGPVQPQTLERILEVLNIELGQMVTWALAPLRRFISEGEVDAVQGGQMNEITFPCGVGNYWFEDFQEYVGKPCATLGDLDWKTTRSYLDRIPTELERVDFLMRLEQLPDDGVVNNSIVNPGVHNRNTREFIHPLREECTILLSRHFNLENLLKRERQIGSHQDALTYLWDALREYKRYHPNTRHNSYYSQDIVFCTTVEEEIKCRKDLLAATGQTKLTAIRELIVGDKYEAGQAGAIGPNAHAHDMTMSQTWNRLEGQIDLNQLAEELSRLRQELKKESADVDIAVGEIAKAEQAARIGDGSRALSYLKSAGKVALDVAVKIGTALAVEAIKTSMGFNRGDSKS